MSRYAVDKVMRQTIQHPAAREEFARDAVAFLAGFDLTPDEHRALCERDYPALYTMGAHPFLIVGFVGSTSPPNERQSRMAAYQKSLLTLGYPDYGT